MKMKTTTMKATLYVVYSRNPYHDPPTDWERESGLYGTKTEARACAIGIRRTGRQTRVVPIAVDEPSIV